MKITIKMRGALQEIEHHIFKFKNSGRTIGIEKPDSILGGVEMYKLNPAIPIPGNVLNEPARATHVVGGWQIETPSSKAIWTFTARGITYSGPFRGLFESPFIPSHSALGITAKLLLSSEVSATGFRGNFERYLKYRALNTEDEFLDPPKILEDLGIGIGYHQKPAVAGFEDLWPAGPRKLIVWAGPTPHDTTRLTTKWVAKYTTA